MNMKDVKKDVKKYLNDLEKILSDNWWITIIIILLLLFAPSTCNGVTHYTVIRGCSTDNNEENDKITEVVQKGYLLNNRVIKPALVIVVKNK